MIDPNERVARKLIAAPTHGTGVRYDLPAQGLVAWRAQQVAQQPRQRIEPFAGERFPLAPAELLQQPVGRREALGTADEQLEEAEGRADAPSTQPVGGEHGIARLGWVGAHDL